MQKFMWMIAVFVVVTSLLAGCGGGGDKEKIVGTWILESREVGGKTLPKDKEDKKLVITAEKITPADREDDETTYILDPSKNPKHIDMTTTKGNNKGKTIKGIYSLEGDTLKMVFANPDDKDAVRPTELKTAEKSAVMMITLKREKAK